MASTYSTNLAIELIGTGDQAGSWGNTTNTNLGTLIEQAISGYVTQAVSTGTDTTITIPNGATGVARNMYIELTGTGGTNTNLIVPANKKLYFIFNNSTGAVTVKVSGQTGVSVPQGKKVVLTSNGTDIVNGLNYIADFGSNSATITQLTATSATITNLTLTSLVISNLSIASANITTLTSASATITNLLGTTLTISGNSFLATSSGNVGVGTTSPAYKLDVSGSLRTTSFWALTGSPTGAGGSVRYIGGGGSSTNWYTNVPTGGSQFWAINESPVMALDSSGNLGIGTTSPAKKLDVRTSASGEAAVGTFSNDSTAAGTNVASLEFASSGVAKASIAAAVYGDGWMSFRNNDNTEKMRLDASGALLVGNTTKYNVGSAENNSVQVKGGIVLAANNTGSASNRNWIFQTNAAAAGSFSLAYSSTNTGWPNAAYAITITSSGNTTVLGSITAGKQDYSFQAIQRALTLNGDGVSGVYPLSSWRFYTTPGTIQTNQLLSIRAQDDTNGETGNLLSLTSTGNLCISVAPSNWSGTLIKAIQVANNGASLSSFTTSNTTDKYFYTTNNAYYDGTSWKYFGTKPCAQYLQINNLHKWYGVVQGTADTNISFGDPKMTLDGDGRLFIGSTDGVGNDRVLISTNSSGTYSQCLNLKDTNSSANGNVFIAVRKSDDTYLGTIRRNGTDNAVLVNGNSYLALGSGDTERARIEANGNVLIGMTSRPIPISNAIGYKSAANGMAGSATMNGTTWVDLVTLPIPTLGGARVNILGNENSNINTYYGTWTMLYSSTGWTIAGPYNEMQVGNDYGVPNLRISAGKIQVQARNGVSGGIIQYNIEYYAVA